ncbi:hypothetical protein TNCT_89331 [Trichonephila clavata]|uniref:Uncharacterized protein n=1 Tax=Trichonephila clavata TaxID=2740835 RepID=A0A8X6F393_TRICU|nr:hypothetical protein TNCT_89331 [Trichonephila clavata]
MDQAPSECRKSLDQLLEQALAERSREEEQVEVTYELTGDDYVCEQHGLRLNSEDASTSRNKDEEEDENEGLF